MPVRCLSAPLRGEFEITQGLYVAYLSSWREEDGATRNASWLWAGNNLSSRWGIYVAPRLGGASTFQQGVQLETRGLIYACCYVKIWKTKARTTGAVFIGRRPPYSIHITVYCRYSYCSINTQEILNLNLPFLYRSLQVSDLDRRRSTRLQQTLYCIYRT